MKTDNEYIAEFMDFFAFDEMPISKTKIYKLLDKKGNPIHPYYGPFRPEQMRFNSCWDWLMPVVEKIGSMGYDFHIQLNDKYTQARVRDIGGEPIIQMATHNAINDVYLAVVALVKHHAQK